VEVAFKNKYLPILCTPFGKFTFHLTRMLHFSAKLKTLFPTREGFWHLLLYEIRCIELALPLPPFLRKTVLITAIF